MSELKVHLDSDSNPMDIALSKNIAEIILKQYPGYLWAVQFSSKTGVGSVMCLNLSGKYGFRFRDSDVNADPSYRIPVRGAGELLERFKMRRGEIDHDAILNSKCVAGEIIFDYHEAKNGKIPALLRLAYDKLG